MSYTVMPNSIRSLEQRIRNLAGSEELAIRRRDEPEYQLADDLAQLFLEVGLEAPNPVPVMRIDHQIAQKLHAVSEPGSERVRDLVDLQLLNKGEDLDLAQVKATCVRLFEYRRQHAWPPTIGVSAGWDDLYEAAIDDVDVLPNVDSAVAWVNEFVKRIAAD